MATSVPSAPWYAKVDADTFLNVPELLRHLFASHRHVHYVGKPMQLFSYKNAPLTYMAVGGYVLSSRSVVAIINCTQREWMRCPNKFLVDTNNRQTAKLMRKSCFVPATTETQEDLYVGVCLFDDGIRPTPHKCFLSHPPGMRVRRSHLHRCRGCPISEHALKTVGELQEASNRTRLHCITRSQPVKLT
jgi:hypothetical protein